MDQNNLYPAGRSYYQIDPQVTGDQLSSHPSHELHNAAYPESDYRPDTRYTPPPPGASSSHADAVGQDLKPYPPPETRRELPPESVHDAAYPDTNYRPGGGYSPPVDSLSNYRPGRGYLRPDGSSAEPTPHGIDNAAYPDSSYRPGTGSSSAAGPSTELSSHGVRNAAYSDSHYPVATSNSPSAGKSLAPASDVIDNAAYPESNYRPGTAYSAAPSPGPTRSRPLPCPKHLENTPPSSQSPWARPGPSSSAAGSLSSGLMPQPTGSELPPPPYQPKENESGSGSSGITPPPSRPLQTHPSLNVSSTTRRQQAEPIPMTTFPVYQNAIGHVANRSNASSALERGYKEYDRDQAKIDETNRRRNRRKWLIGTLATTVLVAAIIGVVVALIKNKVFDNDDDD